MPGPGQALRGKYGIKSGQVEFPIIRLTISAIDGSRALCVCSPVTGICGTERSTVPILPSFGNLEILDGSNDIPEPETALSA